MVTEGTLTRCALPVAETACARPRAAPISIPDLLFADIRLPLHHVF